MLAADALIVDFVGLAGPATKVMLLPVSEIGLVIAKDFTSALVERIEQVAFPLESVAEQVVMVFVVPPMLIAGVTLAMARLFLFLRLTVIVELELPFATMGVVPVIFELEATATLSTKVADP